MPNINFELSDEEYRVAKTVKTIVGKEWKSLFMYLVDKEIEDRGLNKEPLFKTKEE